MPDLRIPVGLFFLLTSLILIAEGIISHPIRVGLPVDLDWGVVLLVFAVLMLFFGVRAKPMEVAHTPEKDG
jgi:hypothetical protein